MDDGPLITDLSQLSASLQHAAGLLAAGLDDRAIGDDFGLPTDQAMLMQIEMRRLIGVMTRGELVAWCCAKMGKPIPEVTLLTPRELQVLALVGDGQMNKEIASHLGISHETVRNHMTNLMHKLGVTNRTEAAIWHAVNILGLPRPVGLDPESLAEQAFVILMSRLSAQ